jgi:hypothetical protein
LAASNPTPLDRDTYRAEHGGKAPLIAATGYGSLLVELSDAVSGAPPRR